MNHTTPSLVSILTTDNDKKFEPVARMADTITDVITTHGQCLPQDLYAKGFTHQEIKTNWHFAEALAQVELHSAPYTASTIQVQHA